MPAHAKHTGIAVLEARWWQKSNTPVRGLFDLIADINCENPHAYHYEMINSEGAAKEAIPRIGQLKYCKYLYIAAHGDHTGIAFGNGGTLSRTELKNALDLIDGSQFTGLYLGACDFGAEKLANHLFNNHVNLKWIAGYSKSVDWIRSSALDLLVFNELLRRRRKGDTPSEHLRKISLRIKGEAGGLVSKLGFGLYTKKQHTGGAKNLLKD